MLELLSDDAEVPSGIRIRLGAPIEEGGRWLPYRLDLFSGEREALLEDGDREVVGRSLLGLEPVDELARLAGMVREVLAGTRKRAQFEPSEPNFSLELEAAPEGFTVVCWLDAGNQLTNHFTWDGLGVRFFTTPSRLGEFLAQLTAYRASVGAMQQVNHG